MNVEIDLLGGFAVRVDGRPIPSAEWRRRQAASLVKLLALAPRRTLHREQVIDALWPDNAIDDAGPRLHKAAHFARRSLGDSSALVLSGDTVSLFPDAPVIVDVDEFERSAKQAIAALDRDPDGGAAAAATAADGWAGELLPDDPYEVWLEGPRDRLRQLHQELLRRSGRWGELALADPADEEASLACARQLAESGNRGAALRQLERLERALRRELGVRPGPAVVSLRAELLASDAPETQRRPARVLFGRDAELRRIDRLIVAASTGAYGQAPSRAAAAPTPTRSPRSSARRSSQRSTAVLPMPAGPDTKSVRPSPALAAAINRSIRRSAVSRPQRTLAGRR